MVVIMVMLGTIFGVIDVGAIAFTKEQNSPGSATLVLALFAGGIALISTMIAVALTRYFRQHFAAIEENDAVVKVANIGVA